MVLLRACPLVQHVVECDTDGNAPTLAIHNLSTNVVSSSYRQPSSCSLRPRDSPNPHFKHGDGQGKGDDELLILYRWIPEQRLEVGEYGGHDFDSFARERVLDVNFLEQLGSERRRGWTEEECCRGTSDVDFISSLVSAPSPRCVDFCPPLRSFAKHVYYN